MAGTLWPAAGHLISRDLHLFSWNLFGPVSLVLAVVKMILEASDEWKLGAMDNGGEGPFWASRSPTSHHHQQPRSYPVRSIRDHNANDEHHHQFSSSSGKASPAGLQWLALNAFLDQLRDLCEASNYAENKRGLKHYLKFLLPAPLRQQLIDLSTRACRIYTLVDLNMFELLLSPTVKTVNIQSIRPFFRQPFAAMLKQLGNGLKDLVLEDSSWLQGRDCLPSALARMTGLQRISLRYLANDLMVATLARNCRHLQEMDVSNSCDVTDAGMKVLCQPDSTLLGVEPQIPLPDAKSGSQNQKRSRKISAPVLSSAGCMLWLKGFRRHSVIHSHSNRPPDSGKKHNSRASPTLLANCLEEDEALLHPMDDEVHPPPDSSMKCIRSLRRLDIRGTCVTPFGIQLILASSPTISILS